MAVVISAVDPPVVGGHGGTSNRTVWLQLTGSAFARCFCHGLHWRGFRIDADVTASSNLSELAEESGSDAIRFIHKFHFDYLTSPSH